VDLENFRFELGLDVLLQIFYRPFIRRQFTDDYTRSSRGGELYFDI